MNRQKLRPILAILVAVLLLASASALAATVTHANGGTIYLRTGPGTEYKPNGTVSDGNYIEIVKNGSVWTKVRTGDGRTGNIKNLYLEGNGSEYGSGTCYYASARTGYATANVNFRAGASTSTASMGTLKKGAKLRLLGENGSFYLAENTAGTQGYVHKSYVSSSSPAPVVKTRVTTAYVHMREGGGMHYDILRTVPKGETVQVITVGNYWTKCTYKGTTGWIKNVYLD